MTHFITGATGVVGSAIILDLLKQTDHKIYCLIRAKEGISPQERCFILLDNLIEACEYSSELKTKARNQCIIIEGEIETPVQEIANKIGNTITQFWHIAASLNFEERFRDEIYQTNVEGTKWALSLSKKVNSECFNYISTAYVVGNQSGILLEEPVLKDQSHNVYESSKLAAENTVIASKQNYRIFRPGIVIGHSKTYHIVNYTGLYGFVRKLVQFRGIMDRLQKGYLDNNRIKMLADSKVFINFIPVDIVSRNVVEAVLNNSPHKVHNLTNPNPLSVSDSVNTCFEMAGLSLPKFVDSKEDFTWIDEQFNSKMGFYNPQFTGRKTFDRTCINSVINDTNFDEYTVDKDKLSKYLEWYMVILENERTQIPITR